MSVRSIGAPSLSFMACVLVGCGASPESAPAPTDVARWSVSHLDPPAAPGSGEPNLALAPDGSMLLSWTERDGEGYRLEFARRQNGGDWSAPREIAHGDD